MKKGDKGMKFFGVIVILAIIVSVFGGVVSAEEVVVYDKKVKVDSRQESTSIEDLTYMATEPATDSTSDGAYGAINPDYRISDSPYLRLPADMRDWPSIFPPEPHEVKGAENHTAGVIYNVATGEVIRLPITTITQKPVLKSTPPYQGLLPPGVVPKSVFPPDDRTRVSPTTPYPWRTICKLFMTFPDGSGGGCSGAIIDGYHVLTAGHCVYSHDHGGWATSVRVVPGLDGDKMPYNYAWATRLRSYAGWTEDGDHRHDWALITLDRNVGDYIGWMGRKTASPSSSIYTGGLNTAGYPSDKGGITMWFDADNGRTANEYNHWYYMDTYGGQSGSPVWRYVDPTRYILTVHAYADDGSGSNHGTRLNQDKYDRINTWCNADTPPTDKADLIDDGDSYSGFTPTTIRPGDNFNVWCDVRNIGTASSGGFYVSYYASMDTDISTSDYLIGTDYVNSVSPFSCSDSDWTGSFPSIPAGTYYVGWIVDSGDDVSEFDEDNNVACKESYQLLVVLVEKTVVSIEDTSAPQGATVTVPINIAGVENMCGANIWLNYNKNVVIVDSVSDGDLVPLTHSIDNTAGVTKMNWDTTSGMTGDFVFAYVTLKAVGNSGDGCWMELDVKELYDCDLVEIPRAVVYGTFTIPSECGNMNVNPTSWSPTINCDESDSQIVTVSASGGMIRGVTVSKVSGPTWLSVSPTNLGDIASGSSKTFTITAAPPAGASGDFTYTVRVSNTCGTPSTRDVTGTIHVGCPESSWTFMIYLDGDNNLEGAGIDDFLEMSSVGSTSNVNIVVQFDRIPGYDSSYDDWRDCKRFLVTHGMTPTAANATMNLTECNMGNPDTLRDFVDWAMTNFPADNYALILWNHGDGWKSINKWVPWADDIKDAKEAGLTRGICVDDTNNDYLSLQETEQALTGKYVQLLGYDACLMHMVEVVYQVMANAGISVGSEEVEPWDGWPYDTILNDLTVTPTMNEDALGTVIVDRYMASYPTYNDLTQSAMDNYALPNLVTAVDNLAQALMTEINAGHVADVQQARNAAEEIYYNYYIDLYHFAKMVDTYVPGATAQAQAVMYEVSKMYEAHGTSVPNDHGLSIYFPRVEGDYLVSYETTKFAVDTHWDEFLREYYAPSKPDLIITEKWLCWPDNCTICYNVTNIGTGTAPACHNTALYVDGVAVAHDHVPVDLAPGESYLGCFDGYTWTYTPPSDNITVCADNNEALEELDENNNCLTNMWMCGDVNGDRTVNVIDVVLIYKRALDPGYPLDLPWAGDVNCDRNINVIDVVLVYKRALDPGYDLNCCCEVV